MNEELLKPYDIAAIPYFPSAPGLREWVIFFGIAFAVLWLTWRVTSQRPPLRPALPIASALRHHIDNLRLALECARIDAELVKQLLGELSVSMRRALGLQAGVALETMSRQEIENFLRANEAQGSAASGSELLDVLVAFEEVRYYPPQQMEFERARLAELVARLGELFEAKFREIPQRGAR